MEFIRGKGIKCVFVSDRQVVGEHLFLAKTQSSNEDDSLLMSKLEDLTQRLSNTPQPQAPPPQSTPQAAPDS